MRALTAKAEASSEAWWMDVEKLSILLGRMGFGCAEQAVLGGVTVSADGALNGGGGGWGQARDWLSLVGAEAGLVCTMVAKHRAHLGP